MSGAVLQKIIFCGCNQLYWEQHILGGKTVNTQTNSSKQKNKTKNTLNSPGSTGSPHPGNVELKLENNISRDRTTRLSTSGYSNLLLISSRYYNCWETPWGSHSRVKITKVSHRGVRTLWSNISTKSKPNYKWFLPVHQGPRWVRIMEK